MGNNYWLNLILLEELLTDLVNMYKQYIGIPYSSEDVLADDLQLATDNFYHKRPQYGKFANLLRVNLSFVTGRSDGETVVMLDNFEILRIM